MIKDRKINKDAKSSRCFNVKARCGEEYQDRNLCDYGIYNLKEQKMLAHTDGKNSNKSQFLYDVDANKATLDAAAYADENKLWVSNPDDINGFPYKAKVAVTNGYVGVTGNGKLTTYINVYRTKTGYVHGCPGNP